MSAANESTLAWCKRRASECNADSIRNATHEEAVELVSMGRVFAAVANRLESEPIDPEWLDSVASKAQAEADVHPNAARRSYCEGQASMARTLARMLRGGR